MYVSYIVLISTIFALFTFINVRGKRPKSQESLALWLVECQLGVISDSDCPVDGSWSVWGPWEPCRGACGDTGRRRRVRECSSPPPSEDGAPCLGPAAQEENCYLINCTVDDFRALVAGDPARTASFKELEPVPALAERCLQYECPYATIETALAVDNTYEIQAENVWNALLCVKHNVGCPVVGAWGAWGDWSACGARCGSGLRWRLRRCDSPPPSLSTLLCIGDSMEAKKCEGDHCVVEETPNLNASGTWSEWGPWSRCSEQCGPGVRRRRRACSEGPEVKARQAWGTRCRGQHDDIEQCAYDLCKMDGGWSGWGAWSPCTRSCGPGRRTRARSCSRPVPTDKDHICSGPRTDTESCHLAPCIAFTHSVAVLGGASVLQYSSPARRSSMFHLYMRFLPLSPVGTLVRRGTDKNMQTKVNLRGWRVSVESRDRDGTCALPLIYSSQLEPAQWHTILVTITHDRATLRTDDASDAFVVKFPCEPFFPVEDLNLWVGEKFNGYIQEVIVNFIPLSLKNEQQRNIAQEVVPFSTSNVAYETATIEEGYRFFSGDQYLQAPCFDDKGNWKIELTVKPFQEVGTILFMRDDGADNWLSLVLQNSRLRLYIAMGEFNSRISNARDCIRDHWIDIIINKRKDSNSVEVIVNEDERLHVVLGTEVSIEGRKVKKERKINYANNPRKALMDKTIHSNITYFNKEDALLPVQKFLLNKYEAVSEETVPFPICSDQIFIGGVPTDIRKQLSDDSLTSFTGVIASIKINGILQDLITFPEERFKNDKLIVSSRAASLSAAYYETSWGKSNKLNLTCLHARSRRSIHAARWLHMDTALGTVHGKRESLKSHDDGRVLRLAVTARDPLRGFYTCRAHSNGHTMNLVTYGLVGGPKKRNSSADFTAAFAVIMALCLIGASLLILLIEGIHDLKDGYGFYRDQHLTPEQEAEEIIKFIDLPQNKRLIGSRSAARLAKAIARRDAAERTKSQSSGQTSYSLHKSEIARKLARHVMQLDALSSEALETENSPDLQRRNIKPNYKMIVMPSASEYVSSAPLGAGSPESENFLFSSTSASRPCSCRTFSKNEDSESNDEVYSSLNLKCSICSGKYEPSSPSVKIIHKSAKKIGERSESTQLEATLTPGQKVLEEFAKLKIARRSK